MRHCRSGIAASIYSGIAASIYSGIAASMHSHSGIAASMQLQRALTAALPPACVHSGSAASIYTAALPPESIHTAQSELMLPFLLFSVGHLFWGWGNHLLLQFLTMPVLLNKPAVKKDQTGSRNTYTKVALESF